jgi:hypothetical protein
LLLEEFRMGLQAGVARTRLSPSWGVELAGWGYYLGRTWQRVRDHIAATALVLDDGNHAVALVAVDLMYVDADFVRAVRNHAAAATGMSADAICIACSHSHNTPTAGFIRGAGEIDPVYEAWAAQQTATAAILAWNQRRPARLSVGQADLAGWTFNRTRENGPVDTRLTVWRVDSAEGAPLAIVVNFQAHPTVMMNLGAADLSRDCPGVVTDILEAALPPATALYFQGSCADVNFESRFNSPDRCYEPGRVVAAKALEVFALARPVQGYDVAFAHRPIVLPTRRWQHDEVTRDREEGLYRLRTGDTTGWRENLGRVMVNQPDRFPERYGGDLGLAVKALARFGVEWTEQILTDLDTRPETLTTEVQAIRVGDVFLVADPAELFTTLALDLRRQWPTDNLMIVGYANDSIGYLPDAYDIERRTYAAYQSPKFKNQFPFVPESGQVMIRGMLDALEQTAPDAGKGCAV